MLSVYLHFTSVANCPITGRFRCQHDVIAGCVAAGSRVACWSGLTQTEPNTAMPAVVEGAERGRRASQTLGFPAGFASAVVHPAGVAVEADLAERAADSRGNAVHGVALMHRRKQVFAEQCPGHQAVHLQPEATVNSQRAIAPLLAAQRFFLHQQRVSSHHSYPGILVAYSALLQSPSEPPSSCQGSPIGHSAQQCSGVAPHYHGNSRSYTVVLWVRSPSTCWAGNMHSPGGHVWGRKAAPLMAERLLGGHRPSRRPPCSACLPAARQEVAPAQNNRRRMLSAHTAAQMETKIRSRAETTAATASLHTPEEVWGALRIPKDIWRKLNTLEKFWETLKKSKSTWGLTQVWCSWHWDSRSCSLSVKPSSSGPPHFYTPPLPLLSCLWGVYFPLRG